MTLENALLFLPGLIIGLTFHEFAHAWSASLLGDDLARRQGRVSLNPLRHLSPLGTLAIFVVHFGWGRPVPVNLYSFRRPRRDYLITSLAGPAANLLLAGVGLGAAQLARHTYAFGGGTPHDVLDWGYKLLTVTILINVILAAINLLPVPPLDGSKIWPCLLPRLRPTFTKRLQQASLVLLLVLLWSGGLYRITDPVVDTVLGAVPASDTRVFHYAVENAHSDLSAEEYASARNCADTAIAIYAGDGDVWLTRGIANVRLGNVEAGRSDLARARELAGEDPKLNQRIDRWETSLRLDAAVQHEEPAPATTSAPATQPAGS